jgi:hypothetical protein
VNTRAPETWFADWKTTGLCRRCFSKDAELSFWNEAKNSLDDTRNFNTLEQKLGGSSTAPLYQAVHCLAKETAERLKMVAPAQEAIEAKELVNGVVTQNW